MLYKAIVFFDLDGTLLTTDKNILPSSIKAIKQLKNNKILPVIATGRNIVLVKDIMKKSGINSAICGNGNHIILNGKSIFQSVISKSLLSKFIKIANKLNNPITYQSVNKIALNYRNELTVKEYQEKHHTNPTVNPKFPLENRVIGCNVFTLKNDKIYQSKFKNKLDIVRNSNLCLDVQNKNINKGTGMNIIENSIGFKNLFITTYAFGDGRNDAPMLENADYGIAMKNGINYDKNISSYVTDTNNNNGIVKGLKHYDLIKG